MSSTMQGISRAQVEQVVRDVVRRRFTVPMDGGRGGYQPKLVVNISARHMHATPETMGILFGPGSKLTVQKWLYQEGYFASEQLVTIIGPRHRTISNIRILGPERPEDQIELSFTDSIALGIDLPVRMSGNVKGTPGCIVMGPKGHIEMPQGLIRAQRHVHMHPDDAKYYGIKDREALRLHVESSCPTTFNGVIARIDPKVKLEVHLDTDEGNACDLPNATRVELEKER